MKRVKGNARTRILLQSQVENAIKLTQSNRAAARYLRVTYNFYKKWAMLYKDANGVPLFNVHKNQAGRNITKPSTSKGKFMLDDILLGKHPTYPRYKLYHRLLANNYMAAQCNQCGYCERRPTDEKVPLVLHHINGDKTDHRLSNLELLCFNCYFVNVGDLTPRDLKNKDNTAVDVIKTPYELELERQEFLEKEGDVIPSDFELSEEEKLDILRNIKDTFTDG